ncbi:MAG: hypothetical protein M0D55_15340 [Elusimicrobiota bacterium]|nr:MAG: hypothetical protein M0D55_15340 [Elusimicrobiota bacterium]
MGDGLDPGEHGDELDGEVAQARDAQRPVWEAEDDVLARGGAEGGGVERRDVLGRGAAGAGLLARGAVALSGFELGQPAFGFRVSGIRPERGPQDLAGLEQAALAVEQVGQDQARGDETRVLLGEGDEDLRGLDGLAQGQVRVGAQQTRVGAAGAESRGLLKSARAPRASPALKRSTPRATSALPVTAPRRRGA